MHYVVQENLFREQHYDMLFDALGRLELPYTMVRIFPFVEKIVRVDDIPSDNDFDLDDLPDFLISGEKVFVFGAVKLARVSRNRNWYPGSMLNENHDYSVYVKYYGDNLLNYDSEIVTIASDFQWREGETKFIRPTLDSKSFTGKLFDENEWKLSVEHSLNHFRSEIFNENTLVQVSSPKRIQKEIRFWVVGGKIITGSQYRLGDRVVLDDQIEDDAIEFAQRMVDKFQLAEAFVIDVCLSNDEWKIVECGCINCAGFYKSDMNKILVALENHFS